MDRALKRLRSSPGRPVKTAPWTAASCPLYDNLHNRNSPPGSYSLVLGLVGPIRAKRAPTAPDLPWGAPPLRRAYNSRKSPNRSLLARETNMDRRSFLGTAGLCGRGQRGTHVGLGAARGSWRCIREGPQEPGDPGHQRLRQAARLEPVRDTFADNARLMGTGGATFAATHHGGNRRRPAGPGWRTMTAPGFATLASTLQSTSKAVTAATAMVLVDRGELDLDAQVGYYWPEYATNGKENTTVRMLLSHACRLHPASRLHRAARPRRQRLRPVRRDRAAPGRRRTGLGARNRACLSRLHVRQPGERGRLPGHRQARGRVPARRDGRAVAAEHLARHARRRTAGPVRSK